MRASADDPFFLWLLSRGYAESTAGGYVEIVLRWQASGVPAETWLGQEQERLRSVSTGLPTATIHRYRAALQAWTEAQTGTRPDFALPRYVRRAHPNPPTELSGDEEARIVAALREDLREPQASVVRLIHATGMRDGEACAVRLEHVQTSNAGVAVHVPITKTGVARTVPLTHSAAVDLGSYLRARGKDASPWLFPSPQKDGAPISDAAIRIFCRDLGRQVGVARLHPHAFRHRLATRLKEAGVDDRIAQAILGHRPGGVTAGYQHPGEAIMRAALERASVQTP